MRRGEGFFGREGELTTLDGALRAADSGTGQLVLLTGEPGIGKTRIAGEVARAATEQGVLVVSGRCHEAEGAPAYWPWRQIARSYRDQMQARNAELAKLERRLAAPAVRRDAAPEQARFELFERVLSALRAAAREAPLLVILDDLHWADRSSLRLLHFVGREIAATRLVVLGTFREIAPAVPAEVASLLGELATLGTTIPVRGLCQDDVARLISDRANVAPDQRLVARIHDATQGNPLFVGEVVRLLVAENRMSGPAAASIATLPIPLGVRAAIARRLEALDPRAREVLSAAAVCGREFSSAVLARTMQTEPATLRTALEEAERLGVIGRDPANGRYLFSHALVRETLYEALPSGTRAAWHCKIGQALEEAHASDLSPYLSELAHHFRAAGDGAFAERAVDYAIRAGECARRLLAYEEAELELGRALESLEYVPGATSARRCAILVALAEAQRGSGRVDAMAESFRRAIELARSVGAEAFGDAVLRLSEARFELSFYDEYLVALLEEALAKLPARPSTLRARLLARLAAALHLQPGTERRRVAMAQEATRMARTLGDKPALAWVLMMRVIALLGPDNLEERLALAGEIIRIADESDYPVAALEAQTWRVHDLLELGDIQAVDLAIDAFARRAATLKQPVYLWHLATWRGMRALLDGRLADAEELLGAALAAGQRALQQTALMHYGQQLLALRWEQGRIRELEGLIRMAAEQAPTVPSWRIELCSIELQNERFSEAQAMIDQLAAHDFLDVPRDTNWLLVMISIAYDATELGDVKHSRQLYELLRPYAGRFVATRPAVAFLGCVSFYLARLARTLGQRDLAADHFAHALRDHVQLGARPWVARTQAEYASLLAERGRAGDEALARQLADASCVAANELGLAELMPRAARALEQVRARSAGGWREVEEPRLAVIVGGRRTMAAAAGRGGGSAVVELATRRGARHDGNGNHHAPAPADGLVKQANSLRREGAIWTILFEGRTILERHSLGLGYIAHLLANPGSEVTAWDLAALDGLPALDGTDPSVARARRFDHGVRVAASLDQALEIGDARAVAEYRERLAELRDEGEEARQRNDLGRLDRLDEEVRFLESELARMVGFGSRPRQVKSTAERARLRVTKAIRYAIRKLGVHDRRLAEHLDVSVKTGMLCSYAPRPRPPGAWSIG